MFKGLAINNSGVFIISLKARITHLTFAVINILTDFLLALLPIPIIYKLHTNLRTKITLTLILGLGLL